MSDFITGLVGLHNRVFAAIEAALQDWLLGALARAIFASTLLFFFWKSGLTKVDAMGLVDVTNALAQMAPKALEAAEYDASKLGFHYHLMAYAGTYGEFLLPALVIIGLFARIASLGMIAFIAVMTYVDVTAHGTVAFDLTKTFDATPSDAIMDQRLLWLFPLIYLAMRGAGVLSLDYVLSRLLLSSDSRVEAPGGAAVRI
ncbi:MAG: DoxX family protein [Neomegalonema sp.]|nr:DoxX family protein [Neomegalonema sp.]